MRMTFGIVFKNRKRNRLNLKLHSCIQDLVWLICFYNGSFYEDDIYLFSRIQSDTDLTLKLNSYKYVFTCFQNGFPVLRFWRRQDLQTFDSTVLLFHFWISQHFYQIGIRNCNQHSIFPPCTLTTDKLTLKYLLTRIFHTGAFWWPHSMRYSKTLVWNLMAARLTIPFPSPSSREMSAPSLIKHFTAESPPELAASNRGVDRTLKHKESNGSK